MRRNLFVTGTSILCILLMFSGCTQQNATQNLPQISLQSTVVEFANATLELHKTSVLVNSSDSTPTLIVDRADAKYLFHNIAGRDIVVKVTAVFYDKDDNAIAGGGPKTIRLYKDYTERAVTLANTISYDGENVALIDHVKIIAVEAE